MRKNTMLYCFTPLVTLTTFFIEASLGLVALARYRHTLFGRLSVLIMFFLSIFQFSEYMVCNNSTSLPWTVIGWVSITFLPVLGLHATSLITRKTPWTIVGYIIAVGFAVLFVSSRELFTSVACPGNYVRFLTSSSVLHDFYAPYYMFFILLAIGKLIRYHRLDTSVRAVIHWFLIGYASFILPTLFVYVLFPAPLESFPSVFCGFAVLLALILAGKVLPLYHTIFDNSAVESKAVVYS